MAVPAELALLDLIFFHIAGKHLLTEYPGTAGVIKTNNETS
jgi:hypothetical protein